MLDALQLTRNELSYRAGGSKRWVWMSPRPNMLVFWMTRRLILDLRIFCKDWISSCFPLNSRNSPRTYLSPFSSTLHDVRNLYFLSRWQICNIRTGNMQNTREFSCKNSAVMPGSVSSKLPKNGYLSNYRTTSVKHNTASSIQQLP